MTINYNEINKAMKHFISIQFNENLSERDGTEDFEFIPSHISLSLFYFCQCGLNRHVSFLKYSYCNISHISFRLYSHYKPDLDSLFYSSKVEIEFLKNLNKNVENIKFRKILNTIQRYRLKWL